MDVDHQLALILLFLGSTSIICQQGEATEGEDHFLECVNDYLYTINCTLSIPAPANESYWLNITEPFDQVEYRCPLRETTSGYFCSINRLVVASDDSDDYTERFSDMSFYEISLCGGSGDGSTLCQLLDEYSPELHIKPNAPCCLNVSRSSNRTQFTWKNMYEDYASGTALPDQLQYQLLLFKTGGEHMAATHNTDGTKYSVDTDKFEPDTEYAATVRSGPNMGHYKGQWSDWSSEVLWRTELVTGSVLSGLLFQLPLVFVGSCVLVGLIFLLYFGPVRKWQQSTFIPTPATYFDTYKECHGDFRSWVITKDKTAEEVLQVDTLLCEAPCVAEPFTPLEGSGSYANVPASTCMLDLGIISRDCVEAEAGSERCLTSRLQWGSPAEDSGCWVWSEMSLEEQTWYCNEYCTLSCIRAAQKPNPASQISSDKTMEA